MQASNLAKFRECKKYSSKILFIKSDKRSHQSGKYIRCVYSDVNDLLGIDFKDKLN